MGGGRHESTQNSPFTPPEARVWVVIHLHTTNSNRQLSPGLVILFAVLQRMQRCIGMRARYAERLKKSGSEVTGRVLRGNRRKI